MASASGLGASITSDRDRATRGGLSVEKWSGKAKDKASTDVRAARAEANQRFVRETLARRQPQYARMVEHVAEAVVRDMPRCRSAARNDIVAEARRALAAA